MNDTFLFRKEKFSKIIDENCVVIDVEVDVWAIKNKIFLGHDSPLYEIDIKFLKNKHIWCHIKNSDALEKVMNDKKIHFFWHESDSYTVTNKGYIITHVGMPLIKNCICVLPEVNLVGKLSNCSGICTDYPLKYK
jgi:hypothetical protein